MNKEQYINQRNQLMAQAKQFLDAGNLEEFNKTKQQVEALDRQYAEHAEAQANYAALQNNASVPAVLQNLGGAQVPANAAQADTTDPFGTDEYMVAFMNFTCRGAAIPAKFINAAANTTAAESGAVVPTTIVKEIIRNLKESGIIFQQLRHMNIQGGVEIPIADLKPTAYWVGEDASEDQKISAKDKVSFSYYGLECKISQSILASVVTIEAFQDLFVELATEAVVEAIERGVFKGTGNGQMLGVCNDPRVTNVVIMTPDEFASWAGWKQKVFAKIKKKYRRGTFYMAQGTFEGYVDGMVDDRGQPVARVNYGLGADPEYRFGGKPVDTVEDDVLTPYETAEEDECVAVYMNTKDFVFNSNMQMIVVHWTDHDNNKKKSKVMIICDGKIADANGVILIKKGAAAAAAAAD